MARNYTPGVVEDPGEPGEPAARFVAEAYGIGINVAVDLPAEAGARLGGRGHVPVLGLLDGVGIRGTLVPVGGGRHRLFLNGEMRREAGVGVGDRVELVVWRDGEPRGPVIPDDVAEALAGAGVQEAFDAWPPSHQREYLLAIEDARRPETRQRRIERTIATLRRDD